MTHNHERGVNTMLEKAARAHWDAKRFSTSRTWDELKAEERTKALRHMRAALKAIREPDEAMVEAGLAVVGGPANMGSGLVLEEQFAAMIDAVSAEPKAQIRPGEMYGCTIGYVAEKGHELDSGHGKCIHCGADAIDLYEDAAYGPVRSCTSIDTITTEGAGE